MTVQMESALACPRCKGDRTISVVANDCHHASGNCPCDTADVACPDCEGTGVVACDHCGEPATHLLYNGEYVAHQPVCDECDDPTGEPRGDHPMGGMGYQHDYAPALEAARRLK